MDTIDISNLGLLFAFLLLVIPLIISYGLDLRMNKDTIWSVGRMSIQLALVGIFLEYIFKLNHLWLNLIWLLIMILTAVFSAINSSKIKLTVIFWPVVFAFAIPTLVVLLYFNSLVVQLDYLFEARYLIALGGMLLGNILSVSIVGINSFYQTIRSQNKFFFYRLAMGSTHNEAIAPFMRNSFQLALLPALAKTATIGIVSLPGMMSGQIIAGSSPATAIRYQIAIMIAIYVAGVLSVLLAILLANKKCFNDYGVFKEDVFK